jgi:hypothetical protein
MFIVLFSALTPFLVWPIEQLLPYPYVIEEIFKSALILGDKKFRGRFFGPISSALFIAIPFSFTESIFYLTNVYLTNPMNLLTRLLIGTSLHFVTTLIQSLFINRNIKLAPLGLVGAGLIHYFLNRLLSL